MSDWEQDVGANDEGGEGAEGRAPRQHALSLLVPELEQVIEGALLAAGEPLSVERIQGLYDDRERPSRDEVFAALEAVRQAFEGRGVELVEVAGGWRAQVRASVAPWVARLWQEKPSRYSRALLETLALIAYRQPITRGEIEQIRGVAVSTPIIKTLTERDWVRVVGHREVPGRPALYATTRRFLDYFGLRSLNELPPLAEIRDASFFEQAMDEEANGAGFGAGAGAAPSPGAGGPSPTSSAAAPASSEMAENAIEDSLEAAAEIAPPAFATRLAGRPHLVLAVSNDVTSHGLGTRESEPHQSKSRDQQVPQESDPRDQAEPPDQQSQAQEPQDPEPGAQHSEPFADTQERIGDDQDEGR